jgi:hypothetical protein
VGKAKGSTLVGLVKALRRERQRALGLLPGHLHHYLDTRVVSSQWYPEEDFAALMRACAKLVPGPESRVFEFMGELSARTHLEGIYADVASNRIPGVRTQVLWKAQHDTGDLVLVSHSGSTARYELTGWDHASPEFCRLMNGYLAEAHRLRGAADVAIEHVECRAAGARSCVWVCRW